MFKVRTFKKHKKDEYIYNMKVSNTYPVTLKTEKYGVCGFKPDLTLVNNIKDLYLNNGVYKVLKRINTVSIEEVHSEYGEKFLFLKSHKDLILLNYIDNYKIFNPVEKYYIPELTFNQNKNHTENIYFNLFYKENNSKVINTHDAFKGFPIKKKCYIQKNEPFFKNFIESLYFNMDLDIKEKEYNCIDEILNTDKSINEWIFTNQKFYYYVIDNVYIISAYK